MYWDWHFLGAQTPEMLPTTIFPRFEVAVLPRHRSSSSRVLTIGRYQYAPVYEEGTFERVRKSSPRLNDTASKSSQPSSLTSTILDYLLSTFEASW